MTSCETLILGAGISGLSASFHLGHEGCLVLEGSSHFGGHTSSRTVDGFTWDEGPHVSFTKNDYVRRFFAASVQQQFSEYQVKVGNYYHGHWIDHPAQCALYQVPEPLRTACLDSFLATHAPANRQSAAPLPSNYAEWLEQSLGPVFAEEFAEKYTRKYWAVPAKELTTDWVGGRVYAPSVKDVLAGYEGPLDESKHYILNVRYPKQGGYAAYLNRMAEGCNLRTNSPIADIDLREKIVTTASGDSFQYRRLINTIPLPVFVGLCRQVPEEVQQAANELLCTSLLLVNVAARHETQRPENWVYVYDEEKFSTRINFTERLIPANAPPGWTGVQVEVYYNRLKPLSASTQEIASTVLAELTEMGLIDPSKLSSANDLKVHTQTVGWANPTFHFATAPALDRIWKWMQGYGLEREANDLRPLTTWSEDTPAPAPSRQALFMAGRFGQWKYFWSDDCVLRGRSLAARIHHRPLRIEP